MADPLTIEKLRDLLGWPMLRPTDVLQVDYDGNFEILRDGEWIGMLYTYNLFVSIFGKDRKQDYTYPKQEE